MTNEERGKQHFRRMLALRCLATGLDPIEVGEQFGMDYRQMSTTLRGLGKLGLVEVERVPPKPGSPSYVKFRNQYTITETTQKMLDRIDGLGATCDVS